MAKINLLVIWAIDINSQNTIIHVLYCLKLALKNIYFFAKLNSVVMSTISVNWENTMYSFLSPKKPFFKVGSKKYFFFPKLNSLVM